MWYFETFSTRNIWEQINVMYNGNETVNFESLSSKILRKFSKIFSCEEIDLLFDENFSIALFAIFFFFFKTVATNKEINPNILCILDLICFWKVIQKK